MHSKLPVTYSRHSAAARTSHGVGAAAYVDNEAKGGEAFERISRGARSARGGAASFRAMAQAATKAANRSRTAEAQSKPGALDKSSVKFGKSKKNSDAPPRSGTGSIKDEEEDDIAEAIARSLGDKVGDPDVVCPLPPLPGEQDDSDIAEAKIMSLLSNNGPAKHTAKGHSYKSIGSGSASSATAPHTALHSLLNDMERSAKIVEELGPEKLTRGGPELAGVMRKWQNTVTRVVYATEAAEHKRIQDAQAQLDYDRVVEDKHRRKIDTFSRAVGAQMLQMRQDHQKELREQKQAYENLLAQQVAKSPTLPAEDQQPDAEPAQPRTVKSPSPHSQDEIDRLTNEITMLKSEHSTNISNMQATHAEQVAHLHRKAERLADANALLRKEEKSKNVKKQEMEQMKQMYEAQLQEIKEEAEKLANQNAKSKQQVPSVPAFQFTAGGRQALSQSTRSDPGPSSQEGAEGWSRKRARRM